jgi:hypothetical protein
MRITLMHNPKAGEAEHGKKELMAALAKAGHHATYQSMKKSDYKKALKKPPISFLPPAAMARLSK